MILTIKEQLKLLRVVAILWIGMNSRCPHCSYWYV